ncbi:MAG: hypothetical protein ACRDHL_03870 [Candidatus Promineifilaceae bacterium]
MPPPGPQLPYSRAGISRQALTIGRVLDRLFRLPGAYVILLTVPDNPRRPWIVEFCRLERLRQLAISRESGC